MLKILHFIFGSLYFQVKGYQTERFLNLCAKNHLVLWELKPVSDGYVFFYQTKFSSNVGSISRESKC